MEPPKASLLAPLSLRYAGIACYRFRFRFAKTSNEASLTETVKFGLSSPQIP
jgi:hypothetical protein